jgi:AraC-like DNA-binding protein
MKLKLQTLSHARLVWTADFPPGFSGVRLPGGSLASSSGEFGSVCIQECITKNYTIRYCVLDILQRFVLRFKSPRQGLYGQLVLAGECEQEFKNDGLLSLRKNQFVLYKAATSELSAVFNEGVTYHSFDAFFSSKMLNEVSPLFPALGRLQNKQKGNIKMLTEFPVWADVETLELAQSILHCHYQKDLRKYFFDSRIRDLLFKYLVQLNEFDPLQKQPSDKEIQAVYLAEAIINKDISKHTRIPELSRKVLLNEFRFKAVFKKIFRVGPYEYLLRQRMNKAKELLSQGLSVKEVAAHTGYRPSDFTTAFTNYFGFTPSSVKSRSS